MEGICGRMCDACTWKEQLDCPGCQDGPGRRFSGGCPIADCCREKGHTACVTCTFSTGCALRRRDMPQNRLWAVEAERERRARLDRNAPVLAKWLWLLFWLVTPSVFSNILTMDTVAGAFPTAGVVGNVLAFLISLAYGVLLWQLREAAGRYRTAALCYLAGGRTCACRKYIDLAALGGVPSDRRHWGGGRSRGDAVPLRIRVPYAPGCTSVPSWHTPADWPWQDPVPPPPAASPGSRHPPAP